MLAAVLETRAGLDGAAGRDAARRSADCCGAVWRRIASGGSPDIADRAARDRRRARAALLPMPSFPASHRPSSDGVEGPSCIAVVVATMVLAAGGIAGWMFKPAAPVNVTRFSFTLPEGSQALLVSAALRFPFHRTAPGWRISQAVHRSVVAAGSRGSLTCGPWPI